MTATQPLSKRAGDPRLRVLRGKGQARKVLLAPWTIVVLVAIVGFLGLGFAQTSLDNSAFELDDLQGRIAEQTALNEELRLEIARLENPARIAPLAEELGMVLPEDTKQILVDLSPRGPEMVSNDSGGNRQ